MKSSNLFLFSIYCLEGIHGFSFPYLQTTVTTTATRSRTSTTCCWATESPETPSKQPKDQKEEEEILGPLAAAAAVAEKTPKSDTAATGTVNERLLQELEQAQQAEKYGTRSKVGKKMGLDSFQSQKTDEERQAALEQARNLNGVNPVVAITGSLFALAVAAALWTGTNALAEFFALHPIESDVYFVSRLSAVFRNVVMGLMALASGFFGVTGMGILLLGVRVAYGVMQGELDPTPLKKTKQEADALELPNVWDLMMNKKKRRK